MNDPLIGKKLGSCFIQKRLGAGGMGTVYGAHHEGLSKAVAIKVLSRDLASNPDFLQRFQREARLAARLEHPNVVQVYDVGHESGVHYISMQFVEGRTLESILKQRGRLKLSEAISVTKRIAAALGAAHRLGVVHRDIKPANVLISKDGIVKVADFGLAKDSNAGMSISQTDQIIGTPYYMSPEQAKGAKVDFRSDLYSLGATFYHMITGQRVFKGDTPISVVLKQVNETPVPPNQIDPEIPEAVCAIIARMMAKDPAARHASAEELMRDLDDLKAGRTMVQGLSSPPSRRLLIPGLVASGLLVMGVILGVVLAGGDPEPPPEVATPEPGPPPQPEPEPPPQPEPEPPPQPEPEPRPKPRPKPRPEKDRRQAILSEITDMTARRRTKELFDRTESFLQAVKDRDLDKVKSHFDRLSFGDLKNDSLLDIYARFLVDKQINQAELVGWTIEDMRFRLKMPKRPHSPFATVVVTLRIRAPKEKMEVEMAGREIHWVHRLNGWFLTRPPRK